MAEKDFHKDDYISFSGFRNVVFGLFDIFFRALAYLQHVIARQFVLLIVFLILGLGLGYLYYSTKPLFYKASMVLEFNELTKKVYGEMIDQLETLVSTNSVSTLAQTLQMSEEEVSKISFIDSKNMNDEALLRDTSSRVRQPFKIIVELRDNQFSQKLETSLVNYFNSTPYLKRLKEEERKINIEKMAFINGELQKLDSLKLEYIRFLSTSKISATVYNNAFNPAEIFAQSTSLQNQKEITLRKLNIEHNSVSIIDGFKVTKSPQSVGITKSLTLFGAAGLLIGLLIGFLIETKHKIEKER